MGFKCGIVGLPNVGKSTIFSAITSKQVDAENYPFCTIEPNVGIVKVPDARIDKIAEIVQPQKVIHTTMEFVDIAGLVKGASKGEGLGNKFLANIREVDAIAHIVRCFEDKNITHVEGNINPIRDIEIINYELIMADLESIERRMQKLEKALKTNDKKIKKQYEFVKKIHELLAEGHPASKITPTNEDEDVIFKELNLLTSKPVLYIANVDEKNIKGNQFSDEVKDYALKNNSSFLIISGKLEKELLELKEEEKREFMEDLGLQESALDNMIKKGYRLLDLITFITAGKKEVKGWTIKKGTPAVKAAGKIHSDIEKGFIRAEVISYEDYIKAGSEQKAKELGYMRLEGKEYIIKDGDIIYFRFNV